MNKKRHGSARLFHFVARHRMAVALLMILQVASPLEADDRQLLQTNAGSNIDVLVILDSSISMNADFSFKSGAQPGFRLPAYMDDFLYPEGTVTDKAGNPVFGSKFGVAKSVLRQVVAESTGVNWGFSYYRNPDQQFGYATTTPPDGTPTGGATKPGDEMVNGGLEWLYFADKIDSTSPNNAGAAISSVFPCNPTSPGPCDYPDIQQGRFLQLGHKVPRNYMQEPPPYGSNSTADTRPPYKAGSVTFPVPGSWRGAFGPNPRNGSTSGMVVYRQPNKPGYELRLQVVSGNYSDPNILVSVKEFGPLPATPTPTSTPTRTPTATTTLTNTPTQTNTPPPPTNTATFTKTFTVTQTFTKTATPTITQTFTKTPTKTWTPTVTNTPTITQTFTKTNTPTITPTFTVTKTFTKTGTATNTPTFTNTPTITNTKVPPTPTNTPTITNTPLPPTKTPTRTFTKTPLPPTNTPTATLPPTNSPTKTNTPLSGMLSADSTMPVVANWYSAAVRGLLAMAPPPPPPGPCSPCQGLVNAPASANALFCAPDPGPDGYGTFLRAYEDSACSVLLKPLDPAYRGFDDPQADPDMTLKDKPNGCTTCADTVYINYVRADQYPLPPKFRSTFNDDPPWGSDPSVPDNDADGLPDGGSSIPDRHNQGAYSAEWDPDRPEMPAPNDARAGNSCPSSAFVSSPCDVFSQDCGGFAHFNSFTPLGGSALPGAGAGVYTPYAAGTEPNGNATDPLWPVVPFQRDWVATDAPSGLQMARLMRFTSSIVSFNSSAAHMREYTLAENARSVIPTAGGTPIAGVLYDAYNYFKNSVFIDTSDPYISCRNYIIVYITDGLEECNGAADKGSGLEAGNSNGGPSKDLGLIKLPNPAARATAHALDSTIPVDAIPVYMVAMGTSFSPVPAYFQNIADNSSSTTDPARKGKVIVATDRQTLLDALRNIIGFKRNALNIAAPAVPAFASGTGDAAQIGAVIPSHTNLDGTASQWSIWAGSLKSFRLDANGLIPTVTVATSTPTPAPTSTPGGPTATPVVGTPTPTPTPSGTFPDQTDPDNGTLANRKALWDAARVLGYTDPVVNLGEAKPSGGSFAPKAPGLTVWPGRKMVWAHPGLSPGVPLKREDFVSGITLDPSFNPIPDATSTCPYGGPGSCFDLLMQSMGTNVSGPPSFTTDTGWQTEAMHIVEFLRGGTSRNPDSSITPTIPATHDRDQVMNEIRAGQPIIGPVFLGPGDPANQLEQLSYFYQDDCPAGGCPPQVRTDDSGAADYLDGYPHKLGDIFHSEPAVLQPPRFFQYLSANLTPRTLACGVLADCSYQSFATLHAKRRKVVFVGSNDGFLHAFDAGVWNRDLVNFNNAFDLGSGREIFAYAPRRMMTNKFPNLIPPQDPKPQYFVDGSMGLGDVFIDTTAGGPSNANRTWKTVLVGTLRQGGHELFALDVTQPDKVKTSVPVTDPTYGDKTAAIDSSPDCLNGGGGACPSIYPNVLWELTDDCTVDNTQCVANPPKIGETWSRPLVGRIRVDNGGTSEDRYVAIFGGGFDPNFKPGDTILPASTRGRALYIVDIETGKIIYKAVSGVDGANNTIDFAPMPAGPAAADYDDDGYLDRIYIGDVNGRMWKIDITVDTTATPKRGEISGGMITGYKPFLLYDGWCKSYSSPDACGSLAGAPIQPIFLEATEIFLSGGSPPTIGVAFGTGNRADLVGKNPNVNRFTFVVDAPGATATYNEDNLSVIVPSAKATYSLSSGCTTSPCAGLRLDYEGPDEKTTSAVFSTLGFLTVVTFEQSAGICGTEGSSFRYRFFYLTGQGGNNTGGYKGDYTDYREQLGGQQTGLASSSQSTSPSGSTIDVTLFSGGNINQATTPGTVRTDSVNWKENKQ